MKNLLYLSIALFLTACGGNAGEIKSTPATAPSLEGFTVQDLGSGIQKATKKGDSGLIVEEGELINNQKFGTWVAYHPSDHRIKSITNYVNGKKNGVYLELNDRGSVDLQCYYKDDILNGHWVKYKFGSRPEKEISYNMGQIDGYYREYHTNGKIQKEIDYKNGKQDGKFRQYNEDGQVVMEYDYKNGEKISGGIVTPPAGE